MLNLAVLLDCKDAQEASPFSFRPWSSAVVVPQFEVWFRLFKADLIVASSYIRKVLAQAMRRFQRLSNLSLVFYA